MSEKLLTVAEVAERLSVARWTVAKWFRSGELAGVNLGGRSGWRVSEQQLENFIQHRAQRRTAKPPRPIREDDPQPTCRPELAVVGHKWRMEGSTYAEIANRFNERLWTPNRIPKSARTTPRLDSAEKWTEKTIHQLLNRDYPKNWPMNEVESGRLPPPDYIAPDGSPKWNDLEKLAKFYGWTIDELLSFLGRRKKDE